MTIIEQGTDSWRQQRLGKVTASRMADVIARTKNGYGASRANYLAELVAERLTGVPAEHFQSAAMIWGTEKEADARIAYSFYSNAEIELVGFVPHPTIAMSGCSPDGFVGVDGLVELKCPNTATMIDLLRGGTIPDKYICQMFWQMACTGRQFCDFVSYDPRLPPHMQLFVQRIQRDNRLIKGLEAEVIKFLAELDATIADLNARYGSAAAA
jgi:putative phage-type endonuclease